MARKTDKAAQVKANKAEITVPDNSMENKADTGGESSETPQNQVESDKNMGQDAENTGQETPPNEAKPDEKPETKGPEAVETEKKRYIFPRQGDIKCPGCGLYETVATSTRGIIQWRRCTRAIPVCGLTFKITGTEAKVTDCNQDT